MSKRALRRHHQQRMKAKAKGIYHWHTHPERFANHLKMCSCYACGNPRKWWGEKTLQERRADEAMKNE